MRQHLKNLLAHKKLAFKWDRNEYWVDTGIFSEASDVWVG